MKPTVRLGFELLIIALTTCAGCSTTGGGQSATSAREYTSPPATRPSGAGLAGPAARPLNAQAIAALIRRLGSTDFDTREDALKRLRDQGEAIRPALTEKAKDPDLDPEIADRIRALIATLDQAQAEKDKATITGRAVDDQGNPVAGLVVRVGKTDPGTTRMHPAAPDVVTGTNGTFAVRCAVDQCQAIVLEQRFKNGLRSITAPITQEVKPGQTTDLGAINIGPPLPPGKQALLRILHQWR